jgi:hypothetical protein
LGRRRCATRTHRVARVNRIARMCVAAYKHTHFHTHTQSGGIHAHLPRRARPPRRRHRSVAAPPPGCRSWPPPAALSPPADTPHYQEGNERDDRRGERRRGGGEGGLLSLFRVMRGAATYGLTAPATEAQPWVTALVPYSDGGEKMSLHIVAATAPAHSQARTPGEQYRGGREGIRGLVAHQARIRRAGMRCCCYAER